MLYRILNNPLSGFNSRIVRECTILGGECKQTIVKSIITTPLNIKGVRGINPPVREDIKIFTIQQIKKLVKNQTSNLTIAGSYPAQEECKVRLVK